MENSELKIWLDRFFTPQRESSGVSWYESKTKLSLFSVIKVGVSKNALLIRNGNDISNAARFVMKDFPDLINDMRGGIKLTLDSALQDIASDIAVPDLQFWTNLYMMVNN